MKAGDPIESQCVRMFRMVYGNIAQTEDDARQAFWQQDPMLIDGWERLAKSVSKVTSVATLEHVATQTR